MAISVYFRPASMNAAQYDDLISRLAVAGAGEPDGRLYHVCFGSDDQLEVFDIWRSQQDFQRFGETLMPVLQQTGFDPGPPVIEPVHKLISA